MTQYVSKSLKSWALATCAVTTIMFATSAHAQAAETYEVEIKAQDLGAALMEFGIQTGNEVLFVDADIEGKKTSGLEGSYTSEQAIAALLEKSGVAYRVNGDGTLLVGRTYAAGPVRTETAQSNSKTTRTVQVEQDDLPVALEGSASEVAGPSGEGVPAEVTGTVTEIDSQANLKGAQVEIVETGQTTATDDLGRFRFGSVVPGEYTLAISYLGFGASSARIFVESGENVEQDFALTNGDDVNTVFVYGTRSARAQSLNLQRTAQNNSEVVSADLLGNFTGSTISEALRRVPGITFQQSSVTGEGTNIIVRGLDPDLNTVTLNGLRLPDNSGVGRSGDLSNILADSVSKITVNKSLLPSHDSSGTGGLIEIETKSPLDRSKRYLNLSIEGGQSGKDFSDDLLASATASGTFGINDQFGLSASLQVRERAIESIRQSHEFQYGQYLPSEVDSSVVVSDPTLQIDPRNLFPFEGGGSNTYPRSQGLSSLATDTSNITLGIAAEWQVNSGTNLRLDVTSIDADRETVTRSGGEFYYSLYRPNSVQALGGEVRQALSYFNALNVSRGLGVSKFDESTNAVSLRGVTNAGNWSFEYSGGYAKGARDFQSDSISAGGFLFHDPDFVLPAATDSIEGRVLSIFEPTTGGVQQPLFTQAGFDYLNDPDRYRIQTGNQSSSAASNERKTLEFNGRYTFASEVVQYIEAGLFYEDAEFDTEIRPGLTSFEQFRGSGATAADLGLEISTGLWNRIGVVQGAGTFVLDDIASVFDRMRALDGAGISVRTFDVDQRLAEEMTREQELSGYLETELNFGKLEIIGGLRMAQVKTTASKLRAPVIQLEGGGFDTAFQLANTEVVNFDDTVTDFLPRILGNYRQSDNIVFRGGYYLTVARPTIDSLSSTPNIYLSLLPNGGPQNNQPTLSVSQGNPGLKPARTHNFDIGAEFYNDNIGVVKFGIFYKNIKNYIDSTATSSSAALDGIDLPDDPRFQSLPSNVFITVNQPINAEETAEIWGAEVAVEHRFANLPGLLDGLGVYGNYTYSDSNREATRTWFSSPVLDESGAIIGREELDYIREAPFAQQPKHSGTAAVTYERGNFDASVSYSVQDRRLVKFGNGVTLFDKFGFDTYADKVESLDVRAEYRVSLDNRGDYRLWLEAQDILDDVSDPTLMESLGGVNGVPELISSRSYLGGRSVKVGISATF